MAQVFNVSAVHQADPSSQWPQWNLITLSGADARDFLHRLTTVNVNSLQIGQGAPGFFLNPQGKIRAFFTLWRFATEDYSFEFDAGATCHWKKELLAAIDQYTFAEKFVLTDVTSLACRWILTEPSDADSTLAALGAPALKAGETLALDDEIRINHHGSISFGRPWLSVWGRPARLGQWIGRALPGAEPIGPTEIESWRIQALRPRVDAEITSTTIPLEAGLIDALAQSKGCYPGQEVIERIISLGAPARRLVRIGGQGAPPTPGEAILNLAEPAIEVGQVTSVTQPSEGNFWALAYIRKIHAKEGLEVRFAHAGTRGSIQRVAPYA